MGRRFRPDLPFSASLLKDNKINYLVDGVQVKNKTNAGIYTNAIFEAAKKANIGPNGRDVRVIRNDDYSYSTVYRYEINSEVLAYAGWLLLLAVMLEFPVIMIIME